MATFLRDNISEYVSQAAAANYNQINRFYFKSEDNSLGRHLEQLPKNLGDPGKFLIPCEFQGMDEVLSISPDHKTANKSTSLICFEEYSQQFVVLTDIIARGIQLPNPSVDEPTELNSRNLPPHLENHYWRATTSCPVIIAKDWMLRKKIRSHKGTKVPQRASVAGKLSDIQGINPEFCTTRFLEELCTSGPTSKEIKSKNPRCTFNDVNVAIYQDMLRRRWKSFMDDFSGLWECSSKLLPSSLLDNILKIEDFSSGKQKSPLEWPHSPSLKYFRSGYQQKDRKPSQNDKTEHGMEKAVQNQGQSPKMPKSESILKNQQSKGVANEEYYECILNPF
ncbi:hypothetical protein Tco_0117914 [Tanacetum coccineum]